VFCLVTKKKRDALKRFILRDKQKFRNPSSTSRKTSLKAISISSPFLATKQISRVAIHKN
jgi:hypothetical protein